MLRQRITRAYIRDRVKNLATNGDYDIAIDPNLGLGIKFTTANGDRDLSPRLMAKEADLWLDAFLEGDRHKAKQDRRNGAPFCLWRGEGDDSLRERVGGHTHNVHSQLTVHVDGYGDATSQDGHGDVAVLEIYDGQLRLYVWADIGREDPTHIIDLEGARESRRLPEPSDIKFEGSGS